MRSVLVEVPFLNPSVYGEWGYSQIADLRKWCYKNTKSPWCTYDLQRELISTERLVVFEFDNNKEAMKFKLYTGT